MKAVIMAGGEGSRLRPLTCDLPKPMVPVLGRPVMEYIAGLLHKNGMDQVAVTLQYLPKVITDHFGDGSRFGLEMRYFVEESPLGTAGSVRNTGDFLDSDFLIISGDAVCDFDLLEAVKFHRERGAAATLLLNRVGVPLEYGVVVTDGDGKILRFLEKPGWPQAFADTVNTGIYILSPECLELIPKDRPYDFGKELFPLMLSKEMPLYGYCADGYWCDIGDIGAYSRCHRDMLDGRVSLELPRSHEVDTDCKIDSPIFVGEGVRIADGAHLGPYTVLGDGAVVGAGARVARSILHEGAAAGSHSELKGAILCRGAAVKKYGSMFEGTVLGSGSVVGDSSLVRSGVKIWPEKHIADGATVFSNVVWGEPLQGLFGDDGITGELGVDMTPEYCCRLGAAAAASVKRGRVAVATDGAEALAPLALGLAAGLRSSGASVFEAAADYESQLRFVSVFFDLDLGFFLRSEEERVVISLCGGGGLSVSRAVERKLEANFMKDDFARKGIVPGRGYRLEGISSIYARQLAETVDGNLEGMWAVLDCPNPAVKSAMEEALRTVGCKRGRNMGLGMPTLLIDRTGCELRLRDEKGRLIGADTTQAVIAYCLLSRGDTPKIAVPYTGPMVMDRLAGENGGEVRRVLSCPADDGDKDARELMKRQPAMWDACFGAFAILSHMKHRGISLIELVQSIPDFAVVSVNVPVPEDSKGRVMRQLSEDAGEDCELREGVRIRREGGSVLVIPGRRGGFSVRAEAGDAETAKELCDFCEKEISRYSSPEEKEGSGGAK